MPVNPDADWKVHDLEAVKATLDFYDPERVTVVIGTAALVLQGIKLPHRVPDVDVLSTGEFIANLKDGMHRDLLADTSRFTPPVSADYDIDAEDRILIEPNVRSHAARNLLPFQAFTDMNDNKYAMSYHLARERARVDNKSGRFVLSPEEVVAWKARVGREKDVKFIDLITRTDR